jgi:hypothetical protein
MAKQTLLPDIGQNAKANANFTELYTATAIQSAYRLVFYTILQSTPVYHFVAETLTALTDAAINGLSYSTNNGTTWTTYTIPVAFSANSESLWRVESFNSGYTQGCLTLIIS